MQILGVSCSLVLRGVMLSNYAVARARVSGWGAGQLSGLPLAPGGGHGCTAVRYARGDLGRQIRGVL